MNGYSSVSSGKKRSGATRSGKGVDAVQILDLFLGRKEAGLEGVRRQLAQMFGAETELALREQIFALQIALEHSRIVRVEGDHQAGVEVAVNGMQSERRAAAGAQIRRDANLNGDLAFGKDVHEVGIF